MGAVGKPARGERPAALRIGGHGGGDGAAVDGEVHHGAGKPGASQRIVRGDASLDDEPVSIVSASVTVGPVVLSVKTTAVLVAVLPARSVTWAVSSCCHCPKRDAGAPAAIALHDGAAERR